ncbi:glycosyltransferase [Pannus brasiliensis CCIBt3594]|uniref:Glycosyltransferase n=1 Tax=Pannus brasiliensis CCIBt3594 TaxID=1427578 RepID=A0AAW9QS02_9CHRO
MTIPTPEPFISVIIPTYNRGALLRETIESVLQQTYRNYEVIIIDDASGDGTADWIAEHYPELPLIRLSENVGGAEARNIGLRQAKGDFIAFLDHDDRWMPDYLEQQIAVIRSSENIVLSYCDYFEVFVDGSKTFRSGKPRASYPDFTDHLLMQNVIHSLSLTMIRRSALLEVGFFDRSLRICNDLELYLRLSVAGDIVHLPRALVWKYRHSENACNNYWLWCRELLEVYELFFARDFSHPYLDRRSRIKSHAMVTLCKVVWRYKRDYRFALFTQWKAFYFAPLYRLQLLSTRWKKFAHSS